MLKRIWVLLWTSIGLVVMFSVISKIGILNIVDTFLGGYWIWLIPYLCVSFLIMCTHVLRWKLIISSYGYRVKYLKLLLVYCVGFASGFLSPVPINGGETTKAFFLKDRQISYHIAFSTVIIDKTIFDLLNVLFSLIGFFLIILHITLPIDTIIFIVLSLGFIASILGLFYHRIYSRKPVFSWMFKFTKHIKKDFFYEHRHKVEEMEQSVFRFFKKDKFTFKLALVLSVISWVFMFAEYKFLLMTLGYNASLLFLFMIISVVAIAYLSPIPAALGILEGGQASLFKFTNMRISDGIATSILIRTRDLIVTFIGLIYMFNYGINFKKKKW